MKPQFSEVFSTSPSIDDVLTTMLGELNCTAIITDNGDEIGVEVTLELNGWCASKYAWSVSPLAATNTANTLLILLLGDSGLLNYQGMVIAIVHEDGELLCDYYFSITDVNRAPVEHTDCTDIQDVYTTITAHIDRTLKG